MSVNHVDDPTITDSAQLWRRIHPKQIVADDKSGGFRVSSAAFSDSSDGTPMSVLLAEAVLLSGRTARDVLNGYETFALSSITAGVVRKERQGVTRAPLPDEPAHAYVFGEKTRGTKRFLARHAVWVVDPHPPTRGT